MASAQVYKTSSGVTYTVTNTSLLPSVYNSYDVTITAPDGTELLNATDINRGVNILGLVQLLASGDVITGSSDSSVLLNLLSVGTYVSVPGATGDFIIGVGAATANTYYIGGTTSISGLANLVTGSTINVAGGTATLTGSSGSALVGALNGSTVNIEYGGTFNTGAALASALEGSTVSFGTGGGTLILNGGKTAISLLASGSLAATTIQNYDPSKDTIELQNTVAAITKYTISGDSTKTITLYGSDGTEVAEYSVSLASGVTLANGTYNSVNSTENNPLSVTYNSGNTYVGVCFLADSMIATPSGDRAVQDIDVGDVVLAYNGQSQKNVKVIWAGHTHVNTKADLPDDQAGYPVRILKDAIAEGVPYKDLLITPEHCLFFNGSFVPARMLVNGRSIFYDRSITSYTYFHIETEAHSVIMADGMLTESYLDTGNRRHFRQNGNVTVISGRTKSDQPKDWVNDAAASLTVARGFVEPLFERILQRAKQLRIPGQTPPVAMTMTSDFHLVSDTGLLIHQTRITGGRVLFMIPSAVTSVRLVSRSSRPCDTVGPFVDDRRQLGVCVGDVTFYDSGKSICLSAKKSESDLAGWYPVEEGNIRWTNGNAVLPLGERSANSLGMLAIEVLAGGPYLLEDQDQQRAESLFA